MSGALLAVLAMAALFVGFGLMNRGKEDARRCGGCHGCDDPEDCEVVMRELKR